MKLLNLIVFKLIIARELGNLLVEEADICLVLVGHHFFL